MEENKSRSGGCIWAVVVAVGIYLMLLFVLPAFGPRRAERQSCLNNLKQIGVALSMYEEDWDGKYPLVSGPGREFERIRPDINRPYPSNLRIMSSEGERRWFQHLLAPYARNYRIFICPSVMENGKWTTPAGTIEYYKNRHGGWTVAEGDHHGIDSEQPVLPPEGSRRPELGDSGGQVQDYPQLDPPTTYYFNAVGRRRNKSVLISGQSIRICPHPADAPLVWDTPCGYDDGMGKADLAHGNCMNVVYADGHAKTQRFQRNELLDLQRSEFGLLHSGDGWFAR